MRLKVKILHPDAIVPAFAHLGDAGADLATVEEIELYPGQAKDIPIGIAVEPPLGYFFDIRPRSSTLRKRGLYVHPGTIDNGYRGPLFVYVRNDNHEPYYIEKGARLAQMVLLPCTQPVIEVVGDLDDTDRGAGGFGSTGQGGSVIRG